MRELLVIFGGVFLAELGDKTQIATLMFAAGNKATPWGVRCGGTGAGAGAVDRDRGAVGHGGERWLAMGPLKLIAGIAFVLIGGWTIAEHFKWV